MDRAITISRMLLAGVAVWRLSNLIVQGRSYSGRSQFLSLRAENVFGNRVLDCVCLLSVWFSAQTAIWVAAGLGGVLLNWLLISSISRLFLRAKSVQADSSHSPEAVAEFRTDVPNGEFRFLAAEHSLQANHG